MESIRDVIVSGGVSPEAALAVVETVPIVDMVSDEGHESDGDGKRSETDAVGAVWVAAMETATIDSAKTDWAAIATDAANTAPIARRTIDTPEIKSRPPIVFGAGRENSTA